MTQLLNPLLYSIILLLTISCFPTQSTQRSSTTNKLPNIKYYVDANQNGSFQEITLDPKPQPAQGKDQWTRDFYANIKYPSSARNSGISGIVLLDVLINELGQVVDVSIKQSLSNDCDEISLSAYRKSTLHGYTAALVDGMAVKCRMDVPVGFWLH